MDRLSAAARLMIVSDLDHTMVDHHDSENLSLLRFNALWEAHYRRDSLLVFSTGRSPTLYKQLRKEKPMLTPDITIMSVGTEITYGDAMVPDNGWVEVLNQKWDKKIVTEEASKFPELKLQSETEQRPHKVSFYVDKDKAQTVTQKLSEIFKNRRLDVKIIYSGGMDLDILPQGAGKGQALAYLLRKFKSEGKVPTNTLVCGDSGNDAELFSIPEVYGVMVSNAQEELLQWHAANAKNNPKITHATERCAAGIIQAIGHFKLGPSTSPRDIKDESDGEVKSIDLAHEVVKLYLFYERWRRAEIDNSEIYLSSLKANCCPSGFCVPPSGGEISLAEAINQFRKCYGDKQGKQFWVWVDRVLSIEIGPGTWLVKFHKWELSGEERACSIVSIIVRIKDASEREYLVIWIPEDEQIHCSCKEFEHSGILCRHSLRVLVVKNYFQLPEKYLLLRWRLENSLVTMEDPNPQSSSDECAQAFHSLAAALLTESMISKERFSYVHKELTELLDHVRNMPETNEFVVNMPAHNASD